MNMKILHVHPNIYTLFAGHAMYDLAKEQAIAGNDVTVYTTNAYNSTESICSYGKKGIGKLTVYNFQIKFQDRNFFFSPSIISRARKEIKSFDIIHLHDAPWNFQNIIIHLLAGKRKPHVYQPHHSVNFLRRKFNIVKFYTQFHGKRGAEKVFNLTAKKCRTSLGIKGILTQFTKGMIESSSRVIAESNTEKKILIDKGVDEHKISKVPLAVESTFLNMSIEKGKFREQMGLSGKKLITSVGKLHWKKGLLFLATAFAEIAAENDDTVLVLVGKDRGLLQSLRPVLAKLNILEKIVITGLVSDEQKTEAYVDSSVLVLPSIEEGFGRTPLEAAACGTPSVVTTSCGVSEYIRKGKFGFTVRYGDVKNLKKCLEKIIRNENLSMKMGQKGKVFVESNLTWKKVATRMEEIYSEIISENKN